MADILEGPRTPDAPSIPTWDERLHVPLRRQPTPADLVRLQRAARGGAEDELGAADLRFLRERRIMIERAQASGVPYWRQALVSIITAIDNVQDIVATAAWMGGPLLRKMGKLGPWLHGEVKQTATALNSLERGLGGPLPGGREKHKHMNQRQADARRRTGAIGGLQRGMQWFEKSQGHLIEAAQASDTLFGVGLTLGAIMGALEETYWRSGQQLYYTAMGAANVAIAELAGLSPAGRAAAQEAAATYATAGLAVEPAPPIGWAQGIYRQMLTPTEPVRTWGAWAHFGETATSDLPIGEGDAALLALSGAGVSIATGAGVAAIARVLSDAQIRDLIVPAPRVRDPVTRALLEEAGAPLDFAGFGTGDWRTPELTLAEHIDQVQERVQPSRFGWLPHDRTTARGQLLHQLVEVQMPAAAALLTGSAAGLADKVTPEDQLFFRVIELNAPPPAYASRSQLEQWADYMIAARQADPDAWRAQSFREISTAYWRSHPRAEALTEQLSPEALRAFGR